MQSVTREVILKIKTQQAAAHGPAKLDFKDISAHVSKVGKELKMQLPDLRATAAIWERIAKAAEKTATAVARIRGSQQQQRGSGQQSGSSGGGMGLAMLGRFAPHALLASGAMIAGNEARTFLPAWWGQRLHGGPLRRGSMPFLEGIMDTVSGRDQREYMEDVRRTEHDIRLQQETGLWQAQQQFRANMADEQMAGLSGFASPQDQLRLLQGQRTPLLTSYTQLAEQEQGLYQQRDSELARLREEQRRQRVIAETMQAQNQRDLDDPGLEWGSLGKWMLRKADQHLSAPAETALWMLGKGPGPYQRPGAMTQLPQMMGTMAASNQNAAQLVEAEISAQKSILANLNEQTKLHDEISKNLQQQRSMTKQIAAARAGELQGNLMGFARMSPFDREEAIRAIDQVREGKVPLSPEQEGLARQIPGASQMLDEYAIKNVMGSGEFNRLQRAIGVPESDIQRTQQQYLQASALKIFSSQPTVNIVAQIDERMLAAEIAKEIKDNLEAQLITNVTIAVQQGLLQQAERRKEQIRASIDGGGGR